MNFKQFLLEVIHKKRSHETSILEAIDFIQMNCSQIVKQYKKNPKKRIYRGVISSHGLEFLYGDSETAKRKSRNTDNFYTLIMDNSIQWKDYPKRSESFICSSDSRYASDFGTLFIAFPVNDTKIGICPKHDLWASSEKTYGMDYDEINRHLKNIADTFDIKIHDSNYDTFRKDINKIGQKLKSRKSIKFSDFDFDEEKRLTKKFIDNADDLNKFLEDIFSPEGFILQTTSNFNPPVNRELWFSGKCIFATPHFAEEIIRKI